MGFVGRVRTPPPRIFGFTRRSRPERTRSKGEPHAFLRSPGIPPFGFMRPVYGHPGNDRVGA